MLIPVFFLSLIHWPANSQTQNPGAASASLGGAMVCMQGYWCSGQNQAGLGFIDESSISLQHSMPYLLKEMGVSSLCGQFTSQRGALGIVLSTQGLKGFRQNSIWLSYGLKLHPQISAGLGMHLWNSTLPEQLFYAPGISFAIGLQIRVNEQWILGARLFHPAGWSTLAAFSRQELMSIESGFSYSFFKVSRVLFDLRIKPGDKIILSSGMEWILNKQINLSIGICNRPFTYSWGISLSFTKWIAAFSFQYRADTGLSPLSSLCHAW